MTRIGAYDARTHFAELLDRAEAGERITITRHGREVAVLGPVSPSTDRTAAEAVVGLLELRRGQTLGPDLSLRDLVDEGRAG